MRTLVALDVETTGLDSERDAIIEFGAVRFRDTHVDEPFHQLINPGRPLPPEIVNLTGITDDMLAGAPRMTQVLEEIRSYVGDDPILGHSVQFDLAFLQPRGLFQDNQRLDTYDLASVLMPSAARYSLSALASALAVPVRETHRALSDAQTTRMVFMRLMDTVRELPWELVEEVSLLGAEVEWGAGFIFDEVFEELRDRAPALRREPFRLFFPGPDALGDPIVPRDPPQPLDPEALSALIEPGGAVAENFPAYEHRAEQVTMLQAVAQALSEGQHLLVEAGTGIGKSLAYLIPAFAWAERNGERVVVSTNTINLQDQLIKKDVPDLDQALGKEYRVAVLKGRANYLCPRRLSALRRVGPRSADEMRVLAKVLVWLARGGSGDRTEITLRGPGEAAVWSALSSDSPECSPDTCHAFGEGACPYYFARQAAERAHVVIVNHALLLADIMAGNRVIPEFRYLIVDEAHHLESATTQSMRLRVTESEISRLLRAVDRAQDGLLARMVEIARAELKPEAVEKVRSASVEIAQSARECQKMASAFFSAVGEFLAEQREGASIGPYPQQVRITPSTRTLPGWTPVEISLDDLTPPLSDLTARLISIGDELAELGARGSSAAEDLAVSVRGIGRDLGEVHDQLTHIVFDPATNVVYWAEIHPRAMAPSLNAAPLEIGTMVQRFLWHEKESVIMTSATLTTAGEFDYMRQRLMAQEAEELALGSPFDYENSAMLYLINDIPEPNDRRRYQYAVEKGLIGLCKATGGRALVLFTSYSQLRRTSQAISGPLANHGIVVYEQGEGASRHALLESFRTTDQAVLLGTRSFWEGVDVPGPALSVLALIRLPFDVPSDPIIAARSETYESPFDQYAVPEAVLRFRQGFGRLIRTHSDRGIVAVFDVRVLTKNYGRAFIDSLPRCTVRRGPLARLPGTAARWLGI
jgi:ATP-dependent DNA helicase DinG